MVLPSTERLIYFILRYPFSKASILTKNSFHDFCVLKEYLINSYLFIWSGQLRISLFT